LAIAEEWRDLALVVDNGDGASCTPAGVAFTLHGWCNACG